MYWEHRWYGNLVGAGISYWRMDIHHIKLGITIPEITLSKYTAILTPGFLCRACVVGTATARVYSYEFSCLYIYPGT